MMAKKKKKSPTFIVAILLLLCIAAGIVYLTVKIFAPVKIKTPLFSTEAVESSRSKITKMLIDETLAFKYKNTKEIPFSELEITSWLQEEQSDNRVKGVYVEVNKGKVLFSGYLSPLAAKSAQKERGNFIRERLNRLTLAFQIVTVPKVKSNRVFFEPRHISFGRLTIPPKLMPHIVNGLDLNPFEKQIQTIKDIRVADQVLLVTVYAD